MTEEKIINSESDGAPTIQSIEGAIEAILYAAGYPVNTKR